MESDWLSISLNTLWAYKHMIHPTLTRHFQARAVDHRGESYTTAHLCLIQPEIEARRIR